MREDDNEKGRNNNPLARSNERYEEKGEDMRIWGIFLFSLIGATVTTFAVSYLNLPSTVIFTSRWIGACYH